MGIGDWGLGIGDWGLGIGPNPQSPIPHTQSPIPKISTQEGKEFAESNGMKFIETSAKDNTKVQEAFELLTSEIIK